MCCANSPIGTPACNNQNISKSGNECESNSNAEEYHRTRLECVHGDRGVNELYIKELKCGTSLPTTTNVQDRVCDIINDKWKWETSCECKRLQMLEKMYGDSDYENALRIAMQSTFDGDYASLKGKLEQWKVYYQCGGEFECDITADAFTSKPTSDPTAGPTTPTMATTPTKAPTDDESSAFEFCLNKLYVFCVITFLSVCL